MFKNAFLLSSLIFLGCLGLSQSTTRQVYMDRALIERSNSLITVTANAPLPLYQAISAIREGYGWRINWEQAPGYSRFDVVDDTGPKWRAAHPDIKGVTRPAGGRFNTAFLEPTDPASLSSEVDALTRLLEDYNATDNPGKYVLYDDRNGHIAIVGTKVRNEAGELQTVPALLDTPLTIDRAARNAYETVRAILAALSATTGKKIIVMSVPNNILANAQLAVGGHNIPARKLLQQVLDDTHRPLYYDFGYDPDVPVYVLNVSMTPERGR